MPTKQLGHFTSDIKITGMKLLPKKEESDDDIYIYTAKKGKTVFTFTSESDIFRINDEVTLDVNITRETSKQTKL